MTVRLAQFNVWPVLHRELREGARRAVNHRLRFLSAGVGTLVLWSVAGRTDLSTAQLSGWLLSSLHSWFLVLVFVIVPVLTADCLAREKREGTLGLLFLTPLSAGGIVAGKLLAQVLRLFSLWLAVLPLLTISFLAGGVTWFDALSALSLEFCAVALCLAAGLLASTLVRERGSAFVLAFLLSALFWFLFTQLFQFLLMVSWRGWAFVQQTNLLQASAELIMLFTGRLGVGVTGSWSALAFFSKVLSNNWKWLCVASPLAVVLLGLLVSRLAAFTIERSWQEKVPSARRQRWLRRYCTPLFQRHFRRRSRRCLDWNPVAWLQHYSWKARLSRLGLCLGLVCLLCGASALPEPDWQFVFKLLLLISAGCYSFVGVSGFLEEKRSGALELLLVTPLSPGQIIVGRAWGLWKQFLPAGLVLVGAYLYAGMDNDLPEDLSPGTALVCGFFTLPVFATYFALRVRQLVVAAVLTWVALFLPFFFAMEITYFVLGIEPGQSAIQPFLVVLANAAFACLAGGLLRHSLARRIYSF